MRPLAFDHAFRHLLSELYFVQQHVVVRQARFMGLYHEQIPERYVALLAQPFEIGG